MTGAEHMQSRPCPILHQQIQDENAQGVSSTRLTLMAEERSSAEVQAGQSSKAALLKAACCDLGAARAAEAGQAGQLCQSGQACMRVLSVPILAALT